MKRLLREVFAEQLSIKQRLSDAEAAAKGAAQLEAADDYQLRLALGGSSSWTRAPVRISGHVVAAGVLPWSQVGSPWGYKLAPCPSVMWCADGALAFGVFHWQCINRPVAGKATAKSTLLALAKSMPTVGHWCIGQPDPFY